MALGRQLGHSESAYLEFRTDEDESLPKLLDHPRHFVSLTPFTRWQLTPSWT